MLQTKALYNLLRLNVGHDPSIKADAWALEDMRKVPLDQLLGRLKLDKEKFLQFAENCDTPEELAEFLYPDDADPEGWDRSYLAVFELWRRLVPEKQSLSVFCDELDFRISQYENDEVTSDEQVQDALSNLLEVLEENSDTGAKPHQVFSAINDYCAHDLDRFLYDYIADLLDSDNELYASELIEGFTPYVKEKYWFDLLRARLTATWDVTEANKMVRTLLGKKLDLSLLMEILDYLSIHGDHELFKATVKKVVPMIDSKDLQKELITMVAEYFHRLDDDEKEQAVQKMTNLDAVLKIL
jgi:hypothetical protein